MLIKTAIIKKLPSGKYRLYSRKKDPKTNERKNLGTYDSLEAVKKREKEVQYFKQHASDGEADDKETKSLAKLSDIAEYLTQAGFIDAADKVYVAMSAIDGSLDGDGDCIIDMFITTDEERNVGGGLGVIPGSAGGGSPGLLSIAEGKKVAELANVFDKKGYYDEANAIDDILEIINKLEKKEKKKKEQTVEPNKKKKKQKEEVVTRNTGKAGIGVIDNQNAGMFQGFSDSYFFHGPGSIEDNI